MLILIVTAAFAAVLAARCWQPAALLATGAGVTALAMALTADNIGRAPAAVAILTATAWFAALPGTTRGSVPEAANRNTIGLALAGATPVIWMTSSQNLAMTVLPLAAALGSFGFRSIAESRALRFESAICRPFRQAGVMASRSGAAPRVTGVYGDITSWITGQWSRIGARPTSRQWCQVGAVLVGFALRLAWAVAMTETPLPVTRSRLIGDYYSTMNLNFAEQFARGDMPSIGGHHTALWPPGYSLLLSPVAWLSGNTGWFSLGFGASLANLLLGTASICLVGGIATRLVSNAAAAPAMWLLALAPSQIYATAVATLDTVTVTVVLTTVWAMLAATQHQRRAGRSDRLALVGVLVGIGMLISPLAASMLVLGPLVVRMVDGRWRGAWKAPVVMLFGALIVLGPWTIRNGTQVGWWSPTATSVAEGLCTTKHASSVPFNRVSTFDERMMPVLEDCFRFSPADNPDPAYEFDKVMPASWDFAAPDEPRQARRNLIGAVSWFVTHPRDVASDAPAKIWGLVGGDTRGPLDYVTAFGQRPILPIEQIEVLTLSANVWYLGVAIMSIAGLLLMRSLRSLILLWVYPLLVVAQAALAPYAFSRHFFSAQPFLVLLSAGLLSAVVLSPLSATVSARTFGRDDACH